MEIAILVFFIAIFGGVLFLLALAWFIFRRIRKSRSGTSRNFVGSSNSGGDSASENYIESDDDSAAVYAGSALFANQDSENQTVTETAQEINPQQSDKTYSHETHGASAVPIESSYTESSYSGYESSSSYDSGSGLSDSSSSSSDSGSSSSSSD